MFLLKIKFEHKQLCFTPLIGSTVKVAIVSVIIISDVFGLIV